MGRPLAICTERKRPACVLIQAVMGGDRLLLDEFPNDCWVVDGIETIKLFNVEEADVPRLRAIFQGRT